MAAVDVVQVLGLKFVAAARADARLEVEPLKSLRSSCNKARAPFKTSDCAAASAEAFVGAWLTSPKLPPPRLLYSSPWSLRTRWKYPRRRIEVAFQVSRPAFQPRTRPCERSKRLRSTMNRTLTSPDSVVSPQSQRAQFSIPFILPGNTHAARSSSHFRTVDPLF